jgi:radical SAM protein with 4Fe4S-binding SPASM domain
MRATNTGAAPENFTLRQVKKRRAGELIPREVSLETTFACNLKCSHCYLDPYINKPQHDELSTSEWAGVFKQLFEMGVFLVTFSGGEPLCRPDILEMMDCAREQGLFFGLKTNGTLVTEAIADQLKELGLTGVDISLYGARPTTHEYVTRVAGSFEKTISAIKLLRERKIWVGIKTPVMKCNAEEHREIENIAKKLDASISFDPLIFPKAEQPASADDIRMSDDQLRKLICERNWVPKDTDLLMTDPQCHLICSAGRMRCAISPQGEVFPCALWRISLGDLRHQTFKSIWHGEAAHRVRAIEVSRMPACASCELENYCSRCPGMIHMENGSISGPSLENCRLALALKGVKYERYQEALRKS